jgi:hypothetical protein
MATSGTIGQTVLVAQDLIDSAARRCNKLAEEVTSEIQYALKQDLYLILSNMINQGFFVHTLTKIVMGMVPQQAVYTMPNGCLEVMNALYRIPLTISGTTTAISSAGTAANAFDQTLISNCDAGVNGWIGQDFGAGNTAYVTSIGFMPFATLTLSLVIEYSQDTVTWTTLSTPTPATTYVNGSWTYWDIEPGIAARAYRLRETAGGDLNCREILMMAGENEIQMYRLNRDDFVNLPNKHLGIQTPPQWFGQRTLTSQTVTVWGVPINPFYQFVFWYYRYLQDVGSLSNQIEVPPKWYKAIRDKLAVEAAFQLPNVDPNRIQMLKEESAESWMDAQNDERDKSPIFITPNISYYQR